MTERTKEILETMKRQALKVISPDNRYRRTWYEKCYARGQLSVLRTLEEGSENENTRANT